MSSLFGLGGGGNVGASGSVYSYNIDQSLRVDDTASQRMYHNTVAGDAQKFTMSCWIKRTELSDSGTIMSSWNGASNFVNMYFSGDNLYCYICDNRSGFVDYNFNTSASTDGNIKYRDVGAWMHVVYAVDSTQSTATDRFTIWVNGVNTNARSGGTGNDIPLNYNMEINEAGGQNFLFHNPDSSAYYGSFYIANMVYVDGTKYDADTFGEFKNGIWTPLDISAQSITYGNNGFYLDFADSSDLGKDVSGEGHHFTSGTRSAVVDNFSAHDQVLDSPTLNHSTIVPMLNTSLSEGNLRLTTSRTGNWDGTIGSFGVSSGKWYHEVRMSKTTDTTFRCVAGWIGNQASQTVTLHGKGGSADPHTTLFDNYAVTSWLTTFYKDGGQSGTMTAPASGDVINIAADFDNGKIWFGINGTYYANDGGTDGDPAGGLNESLSGIDLTASEYVPFFQIRSDNAVGGNQMIANFGQEGTFAGTETDGGYSDGNGYGSFFNSVPSGFLALNSANLSEPTIGPNSTTTSDQHFDTVLFNGTGANQTISGFNFQPDFVWNKTRNEARHHTLNDSVRGGGHLKSSNTDQEGATTISAYNSDGYDWVYNAANNWYTGSATVVSWSWKAGGTAVSNTSGSTTSSVSANQDAGFSIVSYTGTGANATIGHGLSSAPEMIIIKARTRAENWLVYHKFDGGTDGRSFLNLNTTGAKFDNGASGYFQGTPPTASVFYQNGSSYNVNTDTYIAYCFHSSDVCKVGSYTGNGNANGTFVYTGFRPAWVMIKQANGVSGWLIYDSARSAYNQVNIYSQAQSTAVEANSATDNPLDFVSSGFKLRYNNSATNTSGNTYIYLAFAEAPFKYANAR